MSYDEKNEEIYENICKKLGCEPKDVKIECEEDNVTEDTPIANPFKVLTLEEELFLLENKEKYL